MYNLLNHLTIQITLVGSQCTLELMLNSQRESLLVTKPNIHSQASH